LYFWFVKVLLGVVGVGAMSFVIRWSKNSLAYVLKNASIYAQSTECNSILGAIAGMTKQFKSTISVPVFNKLIRDAIKTIQEKTSSSSGGEEGEVSGLPQFMQELTETKLFKSSKFIVEKAYDYVDECILGYCYSNVSEEKSIMRCAVEAFAIFFTHSLQICGKVLAVISIQFLCRIAYWIIYVAIAIKTFKFTIMNVILCYVIGKSIEFILNDAIFEPALMHSVIEQFKKYEWKNDYEAKIDEISEHIPAIQKLRSYYDSGAASDFDKASEEVAESVAEEGSEGMSES
jgi:hypothetical protein